MASAGTANPAAAVPSSGNTSPARGSVHLAVCGHRVLPCRAVVGNGNIHALMRAAFATLTDQHRADLSHASNGLDVIEGLVAGTDDPDTHRIFLSKAFDRNCVRSCGAKSREIAG